MIKFTLTLNDILAFNKHYAKKNAPFMQRYIHWAIFLLFALFIAFNLYTEKASWPSYLIIIPFLILVASVQAVFTNYLRRRSLVGYVKRNPAVVGDREYSFTETEIIVKLNEGSTSYPFASVIKLEESKLHYFAYVSERTAVIIPKRLLLQYDEAKMLIEKIKSSIR